MRAQLIQRLGELKAEYEAGQRMLTDLADKQARLEKTLLRISGAVQVLEEELAKANGYAEHVDLIDQLVSPP